MAWRKWIVRGVVYGIIALCGGGAIAYQRWTNPAAVREQVIAKLHQLFPGAEVSVDSARLRILGGIQLNGLRFYRRDDPEHGEFLQVPSAVFYHDKEKILDGELSLRKIELHKPRLRVRRDRDGKWNLYGLTREMPHDRLIPTVVVYQGTILFEDRMGDPAAALIEVADVNISIVNDPVTTITVRGAASSDALGKLQVQGTVRREPLEVAVAFQAQHVPVSTGLVRRLAGGDHRALDGLAVDALADAHGEFSYRHGAVQPTYYDLHGTLSHGKVQHPQLPLPLEELAATVHCAAGRVSVESLTARAGAAEIQGSGAGSLPRPDQDFEARLEIKHLALGEKLAEHLPEKLRLLQQLFRPQGPTTVVVACARQGGEWVPLADGTSTRFSLRPEDVSMCFSKFAYPVDHLSGVLDYRLPDRHVQVDLAGLAGSQPVLIKGTWQGEGVSAEANLDIQASDVPIDETLLKALPESEQKLARSFRAAGKADIKAHIRHVSGADAFRNEYHVRVHDATLLWDTFPCPFEEAHCTLDIYPKHWEFRDFHATHHGGHVTAHGHSIRPPGADRAVGIALEIEGRNVGLDDDLRRGLTPLPGLQKSWDAFRPHGRLNFKASVNHPTGQARDLDIHVDAQGCAVAPLFFPYTLHDIGGQFRYHEHKLDMTQVKMWHGATLVSMNRGQVDLPPGGGYFADFADLQVRDLWLDEDLLSALPAKLQKAVRTLKLHDKIDAKSRLVIAQSAEPGSLPDVYWEDCQAWFKNARLTAGLELTGASGTIGCVGRHNGRQLLGLKGNILLDRATILKQPFHDAQFDFQVAKETPDTLLVGLRAPIYGGDIAGQVRVDCASTIRYELNLTASQIDLRQFGKQNLGPKSEMEGTAVGRLHLRGLGTGLGSLEGHGSLDVPSGKLLNLPFLFDLLKFLGLHWPDRTAFEELHALFGIHGPRIQLQRLDLLGSAVSVSGEGEANLDGSDLQIDLYPTWRFEQLLPPAVRSVPPAIAKGLLTIEMRGKISGNAEKDLKFNKRWVPIVLDPLQDLQHRLNGEPTRVGKKD
jgi:hypothetical protein